MNAPCLAPGCGNYATYRGRCYLHAKERNREIERSGRATYNSNKWAHLRLAKLNSVDWICEGCGRMAEQVHHREGVEANPYPTLDKLEALCRSCHSRETRQQQLRVKAA